MILPKTLLNDIVYYESSTKRIKRSGYYTKIVLHFKQWWRPRKVMTFQWDLKNISRESNTYTESYDSVELKEQLSEYVKKK